MSPDSQPTLTPQAVLGIVIALLGVIFTLDNLGLANAQLLTRYWPVAAIIVGVAICMQAATTRDWVFGVLWMLGGSLLLGSNLGWINVSPRQLLPLLLVALGARLIWRPPPAPAKPPAMPPPIPVTEFGSDPLVSSGATTGAGAGAFDRDWHTGEASPPPPPPPAPPPVYSHADIPHGDTGFSGSRPGSWGWSHFCSPNGRITVFAILGGVERRIRSEIFRGADLTAIMGGCELDLREAQMGGDEAQVSAFALWGGIEIRVPKDWTVVNESTALMGGVEDATRPPRGSGRPRVVVRGFALMGGIEIKN
jgi:hypothetical protein